MAAQPKTVLCYGDSNTHGTCPMAHIRDMRRFTPAERWPGHMATAMGEGVTVIAEGHPGRTTVQADPIEGAHKDGLAVLPAILETHWPIDAVVMMLGTNDLKARFSVTPLDISLGVEKLVFTIAAGIPRPDGGLPRVLLVAPPPIREDSWLGEMFTGGAEKSRALAGRYAEVADRNGCDFFNAGEVIESDPLDGIHLSAAAHETLGKAIAARVAGMLGP